MSLRMREHADWRRLFLATAAVVALTAVAVLGALTARSQAQAPSGTTDRLTYDAASIKPNKSATDGRSVLERQPGGRLIGTNVTLGDLIDAAYQLRPHHERMGGPNWIDSEFFDIDAKPEGNPTSAQTKLMLQSLLADRFKLVVHRETRQLPIYALVVSKAGKLPVSDETKCAAHSTGPAPPSSVPGAAPPLPSCGSFVRTANATKNGFHLMGRSLTLEDFAKILGDYAVVGRIVVDRTNLSGTYDMDLDCQLALLRPDDADPDPSAPPSIFTALQEQLGLKLEPQTGPVDVLIVDDAEQPSEN